MGGNAPRSNDGPSAVPVEVEASHFEQRVAPSSLLLPTCPCNSSVTASISGSGADLPNAASFQIHALSWLHEPHPLVTPGQPLS